MNAFTPITARIAPLVPRLAPLLGKLGSAHDGEAVDAARAIGRQLERNDSAGTTLAGRWKVGRRGASSSRASRT